jgi:hypothetical protein
MITAQEARDQRSGKYNVERLMSEAEAEVKEGIEKGHPSVTLFVKVGYKDNVIDAAKKEMESLGYSVAETYDETERQTVLTISF